MPPDSRHTPRIIDLSTPLKNQSNEILGPQVIYHDHRAGAAAFGPSFGLEPTDFPEGRFGAAETLSLSTHSGSHLDAPYHFWPTSEGRPARTIDQVPLEWCYSDGVVLDFSHKRRGEVISPQEVGQALDKIGYQLKPYDIVLIRTDIYKHFGEPGFENMHPGMSPEATLWLIEQGIKVMGIDAWGWDRPFDIMAAEVKQGIKGKLWAAHFVGREREYCHMEKLANLDRIPRPFGFKVAAFPINIERASAGWVRAVAIIEA